MIPNKPANLRKARYSFEIKNLSTTNITKHDLQEKKPVLSWEIKFGEIVFRTSHLKAKDQTNFQWPDSFSFDLDLDGPIQGELVFDLMELSKVPISIGGVNVEMVDLANGPVNNEFTIKKRKPATGKSGTNLRSALSFQITIRCLVRSVVSLQSISLERVKNSVTPNRFFKDWANDSYLEVSLLSDPLKKTKSSVKYNCASPSWLQADVAYENKSLKDILSDSVVISLRQYNGDDQMNELLGQCTFPLSDYYSLIGLPVYFEKPLICNEINYGEVNCYLVLPGLPPTSQMDGGSRVDNTITGAQLTVTESPKPKNVEFTAGRAPFFAPAKSVKKSGDDRKVMKDVNFERQLKELIDAVFDNPSLQRLKDAVELVTRDYPSACLFFQVQRFVEKVLRLLNEGVFKVQDQEFKCELYRLVRDLARHERALLLQMVRIDWIVYFLKQLDLIEDEKTLLVVLEVLETLAIVDSKAQNQFQSEDGIHKLLSLIKGEESIKKSSGNIVRRSLPNTFSTENSASEDSGSNLISHKSTRSTSRAKDKSSSSAVSTSGSFGNTGSQKHLATKSKREKQKEEKADPIHLKVISIVSRLCYGSAGTAGANKETIRACNGIAILVDSLSAHSVMLNDQVVLALDLLIYDSKRNREELIDVFTHLIAEGSHRNSLHLFLLDSMLSTEDERIVLSDHHRHHVPLARVLTLPDNTHAYDLVPLARKFIDSAVIALLNCVISHAPESTVVALCDAMLQKHLYQGVEDKFLGNLVQELTLKSERRGALKLIAAYYHFPSASHPALLGALRGQQNAFASLLSEVAVISRENDPVLLLSALEIVSKIFSAEEGLAMFKATKVNASPSTQQDPVDIVTLLVALLNHADDRIFQLALSLLLKLHSLVVKQDTKIAILSRLVPLLTEDEKKMRSEADIMELLFNIIAGADAILKNHFVHQNNGLEGLMNILTHDSSQALYAVKIIHVICFPVVTQINDVLSKIASSNFVEVICAILGNPLLVRPPEKPHAIVAEIVATLKDFSTVPVIKETISKNVNLVIDTFETIAISCEYDEKAHAAALDAIKAWGFLQKCTVATKGIVAFSQLSGQCKTCALADQTVCLSCLENCHKGHEIIISARKANFYCRCGASGHCNSMERVREPKPLNVCTFAFTGRNAKMQASYHCNSCYAVKGEKYICLACTKSSCHESHLITFEGVKNIVCCCNDRMRGCALLPKAGAKEEGSKDDAKSVSATIKEELDDEASLCIVCMADKKDTLFYKCGHVACCFECANSMKGRDCPVCRVKIIDVCKVYYV